MSLATRPRTDTRHQNEFTLPSPRTATLKFSPSSHELQISVPVDSKWQSQSHWHFLPDRLETLTCRSGPIIVNITYATYRSKTTIGGRGINERPDIGQPLSWSRNNYQTNTDEPLIVTLSGGNNEIFHRNVCSAILDAPGYPHFATTPVMIRLFFAALTPIPRLRERLLQLVLWVQLRVIYHSNDHWTYQGRLPITGWWDRRLFSPHAPVWAQHLQWRSMLFFSRVVLRLCFWIGTLFLGLRAEYPEYTPLRDSVDTKTAY